MSNTLSRLARHRLSWMLAGVLGLTVIAPVMAQQNPDRSPTPAELANQRRQELEARRRRLLEQRAAATQAAAANAANAANAAATQPADASDDGGVQPPSRRFVPGQSTTQPALPTLQRSPTRGADVATQPAAPDPAATPGSNDTDVSEAELEELARRARESAQGRTPQPGHPNTPVRTPGGPVRPEDLVPSDPEPAQPATPTGPNVPGRPAVPAQPTVVPQPGATTPTPAAPAQPAPAQPAGGTPIAGQPPGVTLNEQTGRPQVEPKKFYYLKAQDRPYFFTWNNTPLEKALHDLEEMTGLTMIGINSLDPAQKQKPISFQSVKLMDYDQALTQVNLILVETSPGFWIVDRGEYLVIRPLTEWYRNIPPERMYRTLEEYQDAQLPFWEIALVFVEPKEGSVAQIANGANDMVPINAARATVVPGTNQIELKGFVFYIEQQLEFIERFAIKPDDGRYWVEYPLKNASATEAAALLNTMVPTPAGDGGAAPRPARPMTPTPGAPNVPAPAAADVGSSTSDQIEIKDEPRLNRLLVRASKSNHEIVKNLLETYVDLPKTKDKETEVIVLKYADPNEVVRIIQPLLGERQIQQVPVQPRPGHPTPPANPNQPQPMVNQVVSTSTAVLQPIPGQKKILVKAVPDDMVTVKELVEKLDVETATRELQYVQLKYASASSVANILTQTLGQRTRGGPQQNTTEQPFRAVADMQTDRVVVLTGEPKDLEHAMSLAQQLDADPRAGATEHLLTVVHSTPSTMADILSHRFGGSTASGGGRYGYGGAGNQNALPRFIADDASNTLVVLATDAMWPDIERLAKEIDSKSVVLSTTRTYRLKHTMVANIANVLSASYRTRPGRGGGYYGGDDASAPIFQYDQTTNVLIVTALEEVHEKVESLLRELDQPGPSATGQVQAITLENADAEYVAGKIEELLAGGSRGYRPDAALKVPINVVAETVSNRVLVTASPEDFAQAEALARQIDQEYAAKQLVRKTFTLQHVSTAQMLSVLSTMFAPGGGRSRGYYGGGFGVESPGAVKLAEAGNGLVVMAPKDKMAEIERVIAELDTDPAANNEIRTYTVKNTDWDGTYTIARNLEQLFGVASAGGYGRPGPSGAIKFIGERGSNLLFVSAPPERMEEIDARVQEFLKSKAGADMTLVIRTFDLLRAQPQDVVDLIQPLVQAKYQELQSESGGGMRRFFGFSGSSSDPQITALKGGRRIMVAAPESLMPFVTDLIKQFDEPSIPSTVRIVALKTVKAEDIAQTVRETVERRTSSSGGGSRWRRSSFSWGGDFSGFGGGGRSSGNSESLDVSAVPSSNSLILKGPEDQVAEAERLAYELDRTAVPEGPMLKTYQIKYADVYELQTWIEDIVGGGSSSSSSYDSSGSLSSTRRRAGRSSDVIIKTDYNNRLVVSAPADKFPLIEQIIEEKEQLALLAKTTPTVEGSEKGTVVSTSTRGEITKAYEVAPGTANQTAKQLDTMLVALLGYFDAPYVKSFPFANQVIVTGKPHQFKMVEEWLEKLQKNPPPVRVGLVARQVPGGAQLTARVVDLLVRNAPAGVQVNPRELPSARTESVRPLEAIREIRWNTPITTRPAAEPFVPPNMLSELQSAAAALTIVQATATAPATTQPAAATTQPAAASTQPAVTAAAAPRTRPSIVVAQPAEPPAPAPAARRTAAAAPAPAATPEVDLRPPEFHTIGGNKPKPAAPPTPAVLPDTRPRSAVTPVAQPQTPQAPAPQTPAPQAAAPREVGAATQPADDMNPIMAAAAEAVTGGQVQLRYNKETGEVYLIGPEYQLEQMQRMLDDLVKQAEELVNQSTGGQPIRVFQVQHVDVTLAATILEQMFNDKTTSARPGQPNQPNQPQQPAQPQQARQGSNRANANDDDDEEQGSRRSRRRQEREEEEESDRRRSRGSGAGGDRIRVFPDARTHSLVIRAAEEDFPLIAELLLKIDRPPDRDPVEIRIFPIKKLNAFDVEQAIKAILKIEDTRSSMRGFGAGALGRRGFGAAGAGPGAAGNLAQQAALSEMLQQQILELQANSIEGLAGFDTSDGEGKLKINPSKEITIFSDATTNAVIVSAPREGMRLVETLINKLEEAETPVQIVSVKLRHGDAEKVAAEVERVFRSTQRGGGGAGARAGGAFGGFGGGGVESRAGQELRISSDPRTNTIVFRALEADVDKIKEIITLLDVPVLDRQVQTYPIMHANATDLARTLSSVFITEDTKGPRATRIVADADTNTIAVWAPEAQQQIIAQKIQELDLRAEDRGVPRQIPLKLASATAVASRLNDIFLPRSGRGSGALRSRVTIVGDENSGVLFVTAPNEVFKEIEAVAMQLDKASRQDVRIVKLQNAYASDVYSMFKDMLTQKMQAGRATGQPAEEVPSVVPDTRTNSLIIVGSPSVLAGVDLIVKAIDVPPDDVSTPTTAMFGLTKGSAGAVAASINSLYSGQKYAAGVYPPRAVAEPTSNVVYVYGTKRQIDEIRAQIVDPLEKYTPPLDTVVQDYQIPIKYAKVDDVAQTLNRYFQEKARTMGAVYTQLPPQDRAVTIVADPATRQLLVTSSEKNKKLIEALLETADKPDIAQTARQTRVFPLTYADPGYTAAGILQTFGKTGNVSEVEQVKVTPELGTNSVIISASPENMKAIEAMLLDLDRPGTATRKTFPIDIQNADPADIVATLTDIYTNTRARTRTGRVEAVFSRVPGANRILATCSESELPEIKTLVAQLDVPKTAERDVRVLSARHIAPEEMAATLTEYIRRPGSSGKLTGDVKIVASTSGSGVVLTGPPKLLDELEQIAQKLEASSPATQPAGRETHVIALKSADPYSVANVIVQMFARPGTIPDAERVTAVPEPTVNSVVVTANETNYKRILETVSQLDKDTGNEPQQVVVKVNHARAEDLANVLTTTYRYGKRARTYDHPIMVTADANSNSIVISAGKNEIEGIKQMAAMLDQPATDNIEELRVIPLQYMDVSETLTIMQEYLRKPGNTRGAGGSNLVGDIRLQASNTMNALVASGSKTDLDRVEQIVKGIDVPVEGGNTPRLIKIQHTTAAQIAATLTRMFNDPASRQGRRNEPAPLILSDDATNSLIVRAKQVDYNVIEGLVAKLDIEQDIVGGAVEVIPVSRSANVPTLAFQIQTVINEGARIRAAQAGIPAQAPRIHIGHDDRLPALIVSGSPELFPLVRQTLAELGPTASDLTEGERRLHILKTNNSIPQDVLKRVLDQVISNGQNGKNGGTGAPPQRSR